MKKGKLRIFIEGLLICFLFICGVTTYVLSKPSVNVLKKIPQGDKEFSIPQEEEYLEDEIKDEEYLEDEKSQENKEKEDFYNESKIDNKR